MLKKTRKIVQKGNIVLRQVAEEIPLKSIRTPKIQRLILEMKESLSGESDGVALAAPQIAESWRIFVVSPLAYEIEKYEGEKHFVFINPKIIKTSKDKKLMDEGCLSVRPFYGKVRRASRVTLLAYDENGDEFEMTGTGLLAQIFQHETDHLEGILFTDKAKNIFEMPLNDKNYK